jgi:hypothetical protein
MEEQIEQELEPIPERHLEGRTHEVPFPLPRREAVDDPRIVLHAKTLRAIPNPCTFAAERMSDPAWRS